MLGIEKWRGGGWVEADIGSITRQKRNKFIHKLNELQRVTSRKALWASMHGFFITQRASVISRICF